MKYIFGIWSKKGLWEVVGVFFSKWNMKYKMNSVGDISVLF